MEIPEDYKILHLYKTKQYDVCLKLCEEVLKHKNDRMIEFIRIRAMTIQVKVAANSYDEVDYLSYRDELAPTAVAKTPRPGTTFDRQIRTAHQTSTSKRVNTAASMKPGGSALTVRAQSARTALRSAGRASRAATALAGGPPVNMPISLRFLPKEETSFTPAAKTLFEYVYYCEGDVRKAMDIAFQAQKSDNTSDWWWHHSLSRCYYTLGMFRQADECLRRALKQNKHISVYLRLIAMYVALDQPISALDICKQGLFVFHESTPLLMEQARINEQIGSSDVAVKDFRKVAIQDPFNMEAVANIAMYNFYNDQPEIAMRYYRRLLATTPPGSEIYNNLGLCCLYCSQWDLILPCFRQSLFFSTSPSSKADIWFNLAHVALSTGDMSLARRCLQVSLAILEKEYVRQALTALEARLKTRKASDGNYKSCT
ncbi:tetratricopeptide repeat protein 8 [Papilio machaon]|uniref:tetratricopeptide repeat protein 8 n=1 Tax=Papilio machaon TaxID=76193 RepID=UPI001E665DA3|nr:tetratricopeptide repeat protein 8 [Papilio machaon]